MFLKKIKNIIIVLFFSSYCLCAQSIFSEDYKSKADLKVFVVDYPSQADLLVYKVDYLSQSNGNNGYWFFVKNKSKSEKSIYFVDYKTQADLLIHFVDFKSQAGWKTKSKKYLLY